MVAKIARIPERNVSASDRDMLKNLGSELKALIYGQDEAIDSLTAVVKLSRSGLRHVEKPIGSFLFVGPTGVGKTEVCKQLAKLLNVELMRFDMSEYMEQHSVSRLIGAPPGYIGHNEGGLLTEAVNKTPHAVVLLDEIEKAHPDIYNLLLQIMDYGMLTDSNGRKSDFRHVILILTSNVGADLLDKVNIGFTQGENSTDVLPAVAKIFTPELRNRLDAIIQFKPLDTETLLSVVSKFIKELEQQLEERNVQINIDVDSKIWLADHGYDKKMGARPMSRLINEQIRKPLADELLFGKLSNGGNVTVTVESGKLKLTIKSKNENSAT